MRLRSYWRSSCSWRVRIALNLKAIDYEIDPVHLVKDGGEQFSELHTKLNPENLVPVLNDNEQAISQSVAICEYLEECHPTPPLLPKSTADRAVVRQMVEIINSSIQPIQNLRVGARLKKKYDFDERQVRAWNRHWIENGFDALERLVERHGGAACFGDEVTLADAFLVPQLYNAERFDVDMDRYRLLSAIDARLGFHPAFIEARPERQPDCPEHMRSVD